MAKFKIGDRVRITGDGNTHSCSPHRLEIGSEANIESGPDTEDDYVLVDHPQICVAAKFLELVSVIDELGAAIQSVLDAWGQSRLNAQDIERLRIAHQLRAPAPHRPPGHEGPRGRSEGPVMNQANDIFCAITRYVEAALTVERRCIPTVHRENEAELAEAIEGLRAELNRAFPERNPEDP